MSPARSLSQSNRVRQFKMRPTSQSPCGLDSDRNVALPDALGALGLVLGSPGKSKACPALWTTLLLKEMGWTLGKPIKFRGCKGNTDKGFQGTRGQVLGRGQAMLRGRGGLASPEEQEPCWQRGRVSRAWTGAEPGLQTLQGAAERTGEQGAL